MNWGERRFSRRRFMEGSALVLAFLTGSSTMSLLTGCGHTAHWRPRSFPRLVLHNFRLFDGIENRLHEGKLLVIEGGIIRSVAELSELERFGTAVRHDLEGKTLMPGLIDNHVHISSPLMFRVTPRAVLQMNRQVANNFRSCVMNGVTTVRDVGAFPEKILAYRRLSDRDDIPGPRVITSLSYIAARDGAVLGASETVPYLTNPAVKWVTGGNLAERPETVDETRDVTERLIARGAQIVKTLYQEHTYSYFPRSLPNHSDEGLRLMVSLARKHGLPCALHEPFVKGFQKGVELGFDTLEHMPMDAAIPESSIEAFVRKGMAIMPTLMVYGDMFQEEKILHYVDTRGRDDLVPESASQIRDLVRESIRKKTMSEEERRMLSVDRHYIRDMYPNMTANLLRLHRMGAVIGAGSDLGGSYSAIFGRFTDELHRYVHAGISPFDALKMATSVNAEILGLKGKIGCIAEGAFADLIAVEGNPLADVGALDRVRLVMKGGRFIRSDDALPAA